LRVAARFPVKSFQSLLVFIWLVHLLLAGLSIWIVDFSWWQLPVFVSLLFSLYFSVRHYHTLTRSPGDLCWSGENWLVQDDSSAVIEYLRLAPNCWFSKSMSLIHLRTDEKSYTWLFTRAGLGKSLYSQLVYLAKQELAGQSKSSQSKSSLR